MSGGTWTELTIESGAEPLTPSFYKPLLLVIEDHSDTCLCAYADVDVQFSVGSTFKALMSIPEGEVPF